MDAMLINDQEASRLLAISRAKFHQLVAQGSIPRLKIGRAARYRVADVQAFVDRQLADASAVAESG